MITSLSLHLHLLRILNRRLSRRDRSTLSLEKRRFQARDLAGKRVNLSLVVFVEARQQGEDIDALRSENFCRLKGSVRRRGVNGVSGARRGVGRARRGGVVGGAEMRGEDGGVESGFEVRHFGGCGGLLCGVCRGGGGISGEVGSVREMEGQGTRESVGGGEK